jgi:hypothetical protein
MLAFILSSVMTLVPTPGGTTPAPAPAPGITTPAPEAPARSMQTMEKRAGGPVIHSITPPSAQHGAEVIITGKHFTGATGVYFGKGHKAEFKVLSAHKISATVPDDATSARVRVITARGGTASHHTFQVMEADGKSN